MLLVSYSREKLRVQRTHAPHHHPDARRFYSRRLTDESWSNSVCGRVDRRGKQVRDGGEQRGGALPGARGLQGHTEAHADAAGD